MASTSSRTNSVTEENSPKPRKKSKIVFTPTIPEDNATDEIENVPTIVIENEAKKLSRQTSDASRLSAVSSKSRNVSHTYDNKAYDGNLNETADNSFRSRSKTPSVQSLEIYREQYCCYSKRTKCERYLLVTVTVLTIIIIVLVIVTIVISHDKKLQSVFKL